MIPRVHNESIHNQQKKKRKERAAAMSTVSFFGIEL